MIGEKNLVKLGYEHIPRYFLRTLYDADETGTDKYVKAKYKSDSVYFKYWNQPAKSLTWWYEYTYSIKDYNNNFNERDTDSQEFDFSLGYRVLNWLRLNPRFTYFLHAAGADDDDGGSDPDVSKDGYRAGLYLNLYPKGKFSYLLGYNYYWFNYTTGNTVADDPYHAGRHDRTQRINAKADYSLNKNTTIYLSYQYEINNSKPKGSDSVRQAESTLGYFQQLVRLGAKIDF
jgi:predicted porin